MSYDHDASPVNPLPPIVVVLALAIFGLELLFQAGNAGFIGGPEATGWRLAALEDYGFYEPLFNWMVETRTWRWDYASRALTYPFIHVGFVDTIFALVFLLALGKMVGEVFSWLAVVVIFFGASIMGALAYGIVWDTRVMLYGAFPAAYGFIGAYSFLLWTKLATTGGNRMQAFTLIGLLMGLQLVFGLAFGGNPDWVARLAGFVTGFALSFVLAPGGWRHVLATIRKR